MYPERVGSLISLASAAEASPWQIGWSQAGRLGIVQDPGWRNGFYYDAPPGEGPHRGLMLARRIAQIHYRSEQSFNDRFGRATVEPIADTQLWDRFQVESYLDHHGQKLARRFDANSYLVLNKAMDLHDVGRDRGGREAALARVQSPALVVAVDSDALYPPRQQLELASGIERGGAPVDYRVLTSDHGHDGFLLEFNVLSDLVGDFLTAVVKDDLRPFGSEGL
jgi:homoserine O-acetyltransferase